MPTPNMSDEELDALFRRGAAAYPDDVHLGAWSRMEEKLNAAATARLVRHKILRFFAAEILAVAVLLGVWQGYQHGQPAAETARHSRTGAPRPSALRRPTAAPAIPAAAGLATAGSAAAGPVAAGQAATATADALQPITSAGPKSTALADAPYTSSTNQLAPASAASPARRGLPGLAPTSGRADARWPLAAASFGSTARRRAPTAGQYKQAAGKLRAAKPSAAEATATHSFAQGIRTAPATSAQRRAQGPTTPRAGAADGRQFAPLAGAPGAVAYDSLASLSPALLLGAALRPPGALARLAGAPRPATDSAAAEGPRARVPYRLVVGVLGAPSVSAVRSAGTAQLGADYGLTLEYRLTARLRLRASLLSSRKRYRAASSDYQAPAAWQWFPGDYDLDATCRITEIPLDLRYDVLSRPSYTLFTSIGVNSLLMRDERYSYDWVQNGQTMTKAAHVVDGSNHVLSVLNFSVGLERPVGGRWAAQAEPFWQVPLGGIGAGRVRLNSAGLAFSLKYGLFR